MKHPALSAIHPGLFIVIGAFSAYYYIVPTSSQGIVLSILIPLSWLGIQFPAPQGNIFVAPVFGTVSGLITVYGFLLLAWLTGVHRPGRRARG